MAESTNISSSSLTTKSPSRSWAGLLVLILSPVLVSLLVYRLDDFDSAPYPDSALSLDTIFVPKHHGHVLNVTEKLGNGILSGPEDIAYDSESRVIYTGCSDGWIKRLMVTQSVSEVTVENWVHVGGRPLGLAFGLDKELIVAEPDKGLLKVTKDGEITLLTDEAEGLRFKLTDGVDIDQSGLIYFTDASYKYSVHDHVLDIFEGRPYGRLMSFDPSTKQTQYLEYWSAYSLLIFAMGEGVECITSKARKVGSVDNFVDSLPGYPDNIRYDGEGKFWIGLTSGRATAGDFILKNPMMRKIIVILSRYFDVPITQKDGGVIAVNLNGEVIGLYTDPGLAGVTGGVKIEEHLYYASLAASYIGRVNVTHTDNV
ncbi:hypothetical protein IFM89_022952 [Coptis chinensis]|uniref:Strictosidine synthase conserved region domain-containing protein n=1 Tax=Coptis chinensis TaxID=261450 RepID=A0A835HLP4_9MAGN|nr:hypothetical protein IFM89_022952 [Coptis chinensis]